MAPVGGSGVGVMTPAFEKGQTFELDDAALQAAGIRPGALPLGNINLIKDDLETKRLIQPLEGQENVIAETGALLSGFTSGSFFFRADGI